ncbi:hypothetical protein GCM10020227_09590 [Streptomyces flavovirens]
MDPHPRAAPGSEDPAVKPGPLTTPPAAAREAVTPVGCGAAPSATSAERAKPPTALTRSFGDERNRTRRRTAFRLAAKRARRFNSGRNPVVTSCDDMHTL